MRISDWSSDVCSSDLVAALLSSDRAQSPPDRHAAHLFRHASHGGGQLSKPALQGRLSSHRLCHIWFAHPHQQRSGGLGKGYRSEERSVGNEGVSTCRLRWSTYH